MGRLSHPNVVSLFDVGTTENCFFIAMEHVGGGTLSDWLEAAQRSWHEVAARFVEAGRGLAEAHRAGLVHCDFKPSNVLVGKDGMARVSDFGLALRIGDPGDNSQSASDGTCSVITHNSSLIGTIAYMSPEQLLGHDMTPRLQRRFEPPGVDRGVPARLRELVLRGLASRPDDRWPSMDALVAELERSRVPVLPVARRCNRHRRSPARRRRCSGRRGEPVDPGERLARLTPGERDAAQPEA